MSLATSKVAVK